MDENKFERQRKQLYAELQQDDLDIEGFNRRFLQLLESCTFSMMDSEENFFALFFLQMQRSVHYKLSAAVESKLTEEGFTMYFNPEQFLECTLKEMQALIKHEIYHIMSMHYIRAKALKNKYSHLAINLAMDVSINQYLMYLPAWSVRLESLERTYNIQLKEKQTMEEYAEKIQKAIDKLGKKAEASNEKILKSHEIWEDMDKSIYTEQMGEIIKKMANSSVKDKIPESIEQLIKALNKKPEVKWQEHLKKAVGTLPQGHRKTVTRRNRRQPERLDIKGQLAGRIAQIIVAIDISGSVTDKEIQNIMVEILDLVKNYHYEITIIECDSEIRRSYKVKHIQEVKEKVNTRGGTRFSPVFQYIHDNRLRNHVLIYFTDGIGEKALTVKPYNHKTIWVLTGEKEKLSLTEPFGEVIKLNSHNDKSEKINVYELLRSEMKDIKVEWASNSF